MPRIAKIGNDACSAVVMIRGIKLRSPPASSRVVTPSVASCLQSCHRARVKALRRRVFSHFGAPETHCPAGQLVRSSATCPDLELLVNDSAAGRIARDSKPAGMGMVITTAEGITEELTVHNPLHHPQIARRNDGQWVVSCPECQRDRRTAVPIGIGLPLQSQHVAEMLRDNHLGRPPVDRRSG